MLFSLFSFHSCWLYAYVLYVNMMHITSIWNDDDDVSLACFKWTAMKIDWHAITQKFFYSCTCKFRVSFLLLVHFFALSLQTAASMCEKFMQFMHNKTWKAYMLLLFQLFQNIWLTGWLTDWLNIFCGCLNIPQMNRRLYKALKGKISMKCVWKSI